jgi:hypothetical protein
MRTTHKRNAGRWPAPVIFCALLISLILPTATATATSAEACWGDPVREKAGIRVYTRPVAGSVFKAFRGEVTLATTLDSVLALLNDIPACVDWLHQCKSARLLEEVSFQQRYFYQASNMPFPVKDRDYVLLATLSIHEDRQGVRLRLEARPEYLPETKDVRIRQISGFYDLTRCQDDNGNEIVALVWEQHVDPAGDIPKWLVNLLMVDIPYNSLRDFRELVQDEKYQAARLKSDGDGNITGFE